MQETSDNNNPNQQPLDSNQPTVDLPQPDPSQPRDVGLMYEHDCIAVRFNAPPCRRSICVMANILTLENGWRVDRVEADVPPASVIAATTRQPAQKATRFFFWVSRPLRMTDQGHIFPNPNEAFRLAHQIATGQTAWPPADANDQFTDSPPPSDCFADVDTTASSPASNVVPMVRD